MSDTRLQPVSARPPSESVRDTLVHVLRRDLVGPHPDLDVDLARERLSADERPSQWYLTGFIAPTDDAAALDAADDQPEEAGLAEERETEVEDVDPAEASGAAEGEVEPPSTKRRFLPSSIGLTVMLPPDVKALSARVTWGDYLPDPPLPEAVLVGDEDVGAKAPRPEWQRKPREVVFDVAVPQEDGRSAPRPVPESAGTLAKGGLEIETHARLFDLDMPEGERVRVRVVTIFLVNRRRSGAKFFADVAYAFQARLALTCESGFLPRHDVASYRSDDPDLRLSDLHYRQVLRLRGGPQCRRRLGPLER
jgi:hypothetical protein